MKYSSFTLLLITLLINLFVNQLIAKELPSNITITGATTEPLEGRVHMFCGESRGLIEGKKYQKLEVTMLKKLFQFEVEFPIKTSLGKHKIIGTQDYPPSHQSDVKVRYRDGKAKGYKSGTGEIDIKQIPLAEGEQFVAELTAELSNRKGKKVSISVKIDAKAGRQSFDDCPIL